MQGHWPIKARTCMTFGFKSELLGANERWWTFCFIVSLDWMWAASQGERRMAKVGHGGAPGYFWWHLKFWCVRTSSDIHTYACKCVSVCAWEDRHWQQLCWTLIIALMCCCWRGVNKNAFHPCGNERFPDLPQCICLVPRDKTALVVTALQRYETAGGVLTHNSSFCIEHLCCHLSGNYINGQWCATEQRSPWHPGCIKRTEAEWIQSKHENPLSYCETNLDA